MNRRRELIALTLAPIYARGCHDCRIKERAVLELDHVRGAKMYEVADFYSIKCTDKEFPSLILEEVAKCDVVCVNCHRLRTHKRYTNGARVHFMEDNSIFASKPKVNLIYTTLSQGKCIDCQSNDFLTLEFDHVSGSKIMDLSAMKNSGFTLEEVQAEIAKCVIRCANCHRRRTVLRRQGEEKTEQLPRQVVLSLICACGKPKGRKAKACRRCSGKEAAIRVGGKRSTSGKVVSIEYPPVETLVQLLINQSWEKVAKNLGVSSNAVRKHLKKNGVTLEDIIKKRQEAKKES